MTYILSSSLDIFGYLSGIISIEKRHALLPSAEEKNGYESSYQERD